MFCFWPTRSSTYTIMTQICPYYVYWMNRASMRISSTYYQFRSIGFFLNSRIDVHIPVMHVENRKILRINYKNIDMQMLTWLRIDYKNIDDEDVFLDCPHQFAISNLKFAVQHEWRYTPRTSKCFVKQEIPHRSLVQVQ